MFTNYLKIALRNLRKYKVYSFINIAGLAVGMASCLLIYLFVEHELSFDKFHSKAERIYRLNEIQSFGGIQPQHVALSMYPMAPTMKEEFAEVDEFVRIASAGRLLEFEDQRILVDRAFWTDASFFKVFDYELAAGAKSALSEPNSVVLTQETASKLFGDEDPIGKVVGESERTFKVTGILAGVPKNSHLQFDVLFSFRSLEDERLMENWGGNWLVTYLLLSQGASAAELENKFPAYQEKYMQPGARDNYRLYLQHFPDVHLGSTHVTHDYRNWKKFDRGYVYVFAILAVFVLLIASINFTNLSTARSASRAREVGIRKSIGAFRWQLIKQFIGESLLLSVISLALAVAITRVALPILVNAIDRSLDLALLDNPTLLLSLFGVTVLVGVLSGAYPAFFLSSFQPARVLKGEKFGGEKRTPLRHVLVVIQYAIAIALIVATILTVQQLNFMRRTNPGFDREQVLLVPLNRTANEKYEILKTDLMKYGGVQNVTASTQRLGNNIHQMGIRIETADSLSHMSPSQLCVDFNFLSFYGVGIVEGRDFSKEFSTDRTRAFIVNETLARKLGWQSPVGKRAGASWEDTLGTVIGVVKDFHFNSLHHQVESLVLNVRDWDYSEMALKVAPQNLQGTIAQIETTWNELVPDYPFQYFFLDEHFEQLYRSDQQVSQVVSVIAGLAVFIACLGLFGLSAISTEQRTKEIGIRKTLGASVSALILLLTRTFTRLVGIAFLLAAPVTYFLMRDWLRGFAYHIDLGATVFVFGGALSLLIALLTVAYHAIRTARANPVESLRYE